MTIPELPAKICPRFISKILVQFTKLTPVLCIHYPASSSLSFFKLSLTVGPFGADDGRQGVFQTASSILL